MRKSKKKKNFQQFAQKLIKHDYCLLFFLHPQNDNFPHDACVCVYAPSYMSNYHYRYMCFQNERTEQISSSVNCASKLDLCKCVYVCIRNERNRMERRKKKLEFYLFISLCCTMARLCHKSLL